MGVLEHGRIDISDPELNLEYGEEDDGEVEDMLPALEMAVDRMPLLPLAPGSSII